MPIQDRDYIRGSHPPNCNCVECTNKRLKKTQGETYQKFIPNWPRFGKGSIGKRADNMGGQKAYRHRPHIPNWLIALLLMVALSVAGLVTSRFVGSFIPFCLLFGFSVFFCIEKWLSHYTRKYRFFGRIYRLILNLSALSLLGLLIWSGVLLFTQQFMQSPLIGSSIFMVELAVFIWLCRVVYRNSWRQPSMKLTVFSLICLFLIFAFAGVQPFSGYKDEAVGKITSFINTQREEAEGRSAEAKAREIERLRDLGFSDPASVVEELSTNKELKIGIEVLEKVNDIRKERGSTELQWDSELYEYSLAHAKDMAAQKRLFHSSMYEPFAENAWGGEGSKSWTAQTIVDSWMNSSMHRTWLLCPGLRHVAVGVAYSNNGMYAAWTFWRSETSLSDWWYIDSPDNPPEWWY